MKLFSPFNNLLADTDNICWPADVGFVFVKNTCNTTSPDARVAVDVRPHALPCLSRINYPFLSICTSIAPRLGTNSNAVRPYS